jgi:hypothetical protein
LYTCNDLRAEAQQALQQYWFVQTLQVGQETDFTLSLHLYIRTDLFVQVFVGEISGSLYLALIEQERRIFGIDLEGGKWHIHPSEQAHEHHLLPDGLEPFPLLKFFAQVEQLLLENDLI